MRRHRPGVKWECPDVFGEVAVAALGWISPISFCAIPGIQVLILVQRTAKSTPVIPVLLVRIDDIGLIMTSKVEAEEVLFSKPKRNIELGSYTSGFLVAFVWTHETHGVERRCVCERRRRLSVNKRSKYSFVDKRIAKGLAVVACCTPSQLDVLVQETFCNTAEIYVKP